MARRILLTIEYDGTAYSGWQRQYNGLAVQQLIEEALCRATGEAITITGASRTDAGVHALGQCAHFDTASRIPPEKYPFVLNTMLPRDIRVQAGREVPDGFHARFMTCGKRYTYRILNSPMAAPSAGIRSRTFPFRWMWTQCVGLCRHCLVRTISPRIRRPAARRKRPSEPSAWRR